MWGRMRWRDFFFFTSFYATWYTANEYYASSQRLVFKAYISNAYFSLLEQFPKINGAYCTGMHFKR